LARPRNDLPHERVQAVVSRLNSARHESLNNLSVRQLADKNSEFLIKLADNGPQTSTT